MLAADGRGLPGYVVREFEEYVKCGRLEHGFLRVQCESCHHEKLLAFSCKRRGFCPSCGARRVGLWAESGEESSDLTGCAIERASDEGKRTGQQARGKVKLIASIEDPEVIEKILKHLGLDEASQTRNRSPPGLFDHSIQLF